MPNTLETSPASETLPQNSISIARQAILDNKRDVFGYALFDRSLTSTSHTAASDAAMLFNGLSHADSEELIDRKTSSSIAPMKRWPVAIWN
jgi:EAL and modified HD-GYP domain-containing signal transduction protein